jgi:hypothetical protein
MEYFLFQSWNILCFDGGTLTVSVVEYCGVTRRTVPLLMVMISYSLASLLLPWVVWQLPSWHYLAAAATAAVLPVLCCYR